MQNDQQQTVVRERAWGWERGLRAAVAKLLVWHRRLRTRRDLRELETHRLGDIGLTERDRRREAAKWFWRD